MFKKNENFRCAINDNNFPCKNIKGLNMASITRLYKEPPIAISDNDDAMF
jgi:hypothetical protein